MTKSVLVLGSGMSTRPLVHYLSEKGFKVLVASRTLSVIEKLIAGATNAVACVADIETEAGLARIEELTQQVDAVVSMLPYLYHPKAAGFALKYGKHFMTTSYVSDAMRELDAEAKQKGLVFINECGVDPGTDHMSAMRVIDEVHGKGGKVVSFTSFCGGLPAPDSNNNPLGYKFSWAPRGVLLASRNPAHFLRDGKDVNIPGADLFDNFELFDVEGSGEYEGYPNRNSTQYVDVYGIPETKTIIRGTFRNKGWCQQIKKFADLGFLDLTERPIGGLAFAEVVKQIVGAETTQTEALKRAIASKLNAPADDTIVAKTISTLEWLGLFSTTERVPERVNTYLDALCTLMFQRMQYAEGERDMIVMQHKYTVEYPDRREFLTTTLVDYGIVNGDSSMSRTVSLPVGIATRLVLEGKFTKPGIQIPIIPELYNPILDELASHGIRFVDKTVAVEPIA